MGYTVSIMTMPGARKITLGDRTYDYVLKGGKHRLIGWSGKTMRLVVEFGKGKYLTHDFISTLWTAFHEEDADNAPPHKASFTPADVRNVIAALEFHKGGELPAGFETGTWRLTSQPD